MSRFKQKVIHDAGFTSPKDLYEINDQGGKESTIPKSPYAITESTILSFTSGGVVQQPGARLNLADGDRTPGSMRVIGNY